MPISEAKRRGNDAYNAKCGRLELRPRKDLHEDIRLAADAAGLSVQAYILQAAHEKMMREGFQPSGDWASYMKG